MLNSLAYSLNCSEPINHSGHCEAHTILSPTSLPDIAYLFKMYLHFSYGYKV